MGWFICIFQVAFVCRFLQGAGWSLASEEAWRSITVRCVTLICEFYQHRLGLVGFFWILYPKPASDFSYAVLLIEGLLPYNRQANIDVEWIGSCEMSNRHPWISAPFQSTLHLLLDLSLCFRLEGCRSFEVTLVLLFFSSGLLFVGFQGYFGICLNLETKIQTGFLSFLSAKDYPEDFFVFNLDQLWCLSPRPLSTIPQNGSMSDGPRDQGSKSRMSSKSKQCFRRTSQGAELVCLYGYVWIITDNIKEHS